MSVDSQFLTKPIKIHVCKDRTLSFTRPGEKPFNGVAIPVYSVDTEDQADNLIVLAGSRQYDPHPQIPGKPWFKINIDFVQYLELSHLPRVQKKLHDFYSCLQKEF